MARKPGEPLTLEDIAAWCDCPPSTIHRIERRALEKLRTQNGRGCVAHSATMKKPTFNYRPKYGLIVTCKDEADQRRKYEQLKKRGLKVRVVAV